MFRFLRVRDEYDEKEAFARSLRYDKHSMHFEYQGYAIEADFRERVAMAIPGVSLEFLVDVAENDLDALLQQSRAFLAGLLRLRDEQNANATKAVEVTRGELRSWQSEDPYKNIHRYRLSNWLMRLAGYLQRRGWVLPFQGNRAAETWLMEKVMVFMKGTVDKIVAILQANGAEQSTPDLMETFRQMLDPLTMLEKQYYNEAMAHHRRKHMPFFAWGGDFHDEQ